MKTISLIRCRQICFVLSATALAFPVAAQNAPPAPAVAPRFITPEPERPLKLFDGRRTTAQPEPEIIEIVPEEVARAREQQRGKVLQQSPVPEATPTPAEVRKAVIIDTKKSRPSAAEERNGEEKFTRALPNERRTATETKSTPRRSSSSAKRSTGDDAQKIEELRRQVEELKQAAAEARREGSSDPPSASAPARSEVQQSAPPHAAPLTSSPLGREVRKPVATDKPAITRTETTTVREKPRNSARAPSSKPSLAGESRSSMPKASVREARTEKTNAPSTPPGVIDNIPTESDVPVAGKTDKHGFVTSPFPPHNLIDVTDLPKGSLAKDPTTQMIFRVP